MVDAVKREGRIVGWSDWVTEIGGRGKRDK